MRLAVRKEEIRQKEQRLKIFMNYELRFLEFRIHKKQLISMNFYKFQLISTLIHLHFNTF